MAGFSLPLPISKSHCAVAPVLSLSYNSGACNSSYGLGWNVNLPSVQRKTDKQLPLYRDAEDRNVFMFTGVEDLMPVLLVNESGEWVEREILSPTGEK